MELLEARNLAITLMQKHGLTPTWSFEFDNSKRRFGVCRHYRKKIGLSQHLTHLNSIEEVKDTILHEIAHALVGSGHGHDWVWKQKAIEIGCNGERCYSSKKINTPDAKYTATCNNCGHIHKKYRIMRTTRKSSCGFCSKGSYNEKYMLVWQKN